MTNDTTNETEIETTERRLTVRRRFDAPLERVWEAWTDPDQVCDNAVVKAASASLPEPTAAMVILESGLDEDSETRQAVLAIAEDYFSDGDNTAEQFLDDQT